MQYIPLLSFIRYIFQYMTELIIAFYVDFLILSLRNVCVCCLATWYTVVCLET